MVLDWIQVEGNCFGLDPKQKIDNYNWTISGLDEFQGHLDVSKGH